MIIKASTKAEIKLISASRGKAVIEVTMPNHPNEPLRRELREGESYFNTVNIEVEVPGPEDKYSSFEMRS